MLINTPLFDWQHARSSQAGLSSKKLFHLRLHRRIHLDERWPGAFEAFAGEFLRRVDAEFAAAGDFAGGVVEHVGPASNHFEFRIFL